VKRPGGAAGSADDPNATSFPIAAAAERKLDRRRFLCVASGAAALTVAGDWVGREVERSRERVLEISLGDAAPLDVGEAHAVSDPAGGEALVVRLDDTTTVAFDRRCPHLGCPVLWSPERGRFECPCHHAAFDAATGRVLFGPPRRGLTPAKLAGVAV
jgi:arsenite oxidase small subunit